MWWLLLLIGGIAFYWWKYKRGAESNEYYQESYRWPSEIPGHRPGLGDFLPTVGEENSSGGYLDLSETW